MVAKWVMTRALSQAQLIISSTVICWLLDYFISFMSCLLNQSWTLYFASSWSVRRGSSPFCRSWTSLTSLTVGITVWSPTIRRFRLQCEDSWPGRCFIKLILLWCFWFRLLHWRDNESANWSWLPNFWALSCHSIEHSMYFLSCGRSLCWSYSLFSIY